MPRHNLSTVISVLGLCLLFVSFIMSYAYICPNKVNVIDSLLPVYSELNPSPLPCMAKRCLNKAII